MDIVKTVLHSQISVLIVMMIRHPLVQGIAVIIPSFIAMTVTNTTPLNAFLVTEATSKPVQALAVPAIIPIVTLVWIRLIYALSVLTGT